MPSPSADGRREAASPPSSQDDYGTEGSAVHWILYHVLLVTRRRRPLFADPEARDRCSALIAESAQGMGCDLVGADVRPSSVVFRVKAPPSLAPQTLVTRLQRDVAGPLKDEFDTIRRTGSVFVKQHMVTTVPILQAHGDAFAERVPKR